MFLPIPQTPLVSLHTISCFPTTYLVCTPLLIIIASSMQMWDTSWEKRRRGKVGEGASFECGMGGSHCFWEGSSSSEQSANLTPANYNIMSGHLPCCSKQKFIYSLLNHIGPPSGLAMGKNFAQNRPREEKWQRKQEGPPAWHCAPRCRRTNWCCNSTCRVRDSLFKSRFGVVNYGRQRALLKNRP